MVAAPCQIIHVELSERLTELELRPGYQSAFIMFWWRGRPLGRISLIAGESPSPSPVSLRGLLRRLLRPSELWSHLARLRRCYRIATMARPLWRRSMPNS
jgi:hypothetical protein